MKFVYFALFVIFVVICLAFTTDSVEYHDDVEGYPHDENIHDLEEDPESAMLGNAVSGLFSMSKDEVTNHFKDIIRGFSDKGVEACDGNDDGYLDINEIECFIVEKMGFSIKTDVSYVIHHYDRDENEKLDKDEVWIIVEDKDPAIFKILPSTMEKNMLLMHGMQEDHITTDEPEVSDDGLEIRY